MANTTFVSIGCYNSAQGMLTDVFTETLTASQCTSAASSYSMMCEGPDGISYYWVTHFFSMTAELCLQVCTTSGFRYAGLKMY